MAKENDYKEIFISYSTKNSELAYFLCNQLEGAGTTCWIAPRDIESGVNWADAIVKGIVDAKIFVLLVSEASVSSNEVAKEIDIANGMKKIIMPVRIDNVALTGAFLYHLSNKQWVDALDSDKFFRFKAAIEAITKLLDKPFISHNVDSGSLTESAKNFTDTLNQQKREQLEVLNTIFSFFQNREEQEVIGISLPFYIGASGVSIIFKFDAGKKTMRIYANAANDRDPIKFSFVSLISQYCKEYIPDFKREPRIRKWAFAYFLPETPITTKLADLPIEKCFDIFKDNVIAFSDKIFPIIFDWVRYSMEVVAAINNLETELKNLFPASEGWYVGTPEGQRLNGCGYSGKILIYKESWKPKDDYKGQGLLSIILGNDGPFINNIYIGISKYHSWIDLQHKKDELVSECEKIFGKSENSSDDLIYWQYIDDEWRYSGISSFNLNEPSWKGKFSGFIEYCVKKLSSFKQLDSILTQICTEIPYLQQIDIDSIETISQKHIGIWESSLYIDNWMAKSAYEIQEHISTQYDDIAVDYQYRGEWFIKIYLKIKVSEFDAVIVFECGKNQIKTSITNLEPPDFETNIIRDFFKAKKIEFKTIKSEKDFDGNSSFLPWLECFKIYIYEQIPEIVPILVSLKKHLESVLQLTNKISSELGVVLEEKDGWIIENKASALIANAPISFWNKSWLPDELLNKEPFIMFQIYPESPCFDDLMLCVKFSGKYMPKIERNIGAICGACDFAFGDGIKSNTEYLWKKELNGGFNKTGGRHFNIPLIDAERLPFFMEQISSISKKIKCMAPIIYNTCKCQNAVEYEESIRLFIIKLADAIGRILPNKDGWEIHIPKDDEDFKERYAKICCFKKSWQIENDPRGLFSFSIESGNSNFDNLYFGILKSKSTTILSDKHIQELQRIYDNMTIFKKNNFKVSHWWVCWRYADKEFRWSKSSIIDIEKTNAAIKYYTDVFSEMKKHLAPCIDNIIADITQKKMN